MILQLLSLLMLTAEAAKTPLLLLDKCDMATRLIQLRRNASVGDQLVELPPGLRLERLVGEYMALSGNYLVLSRPADWLPWEQSPTHIFLCGPNLMSYINFVMVIDNSGGGDGGGPQLGPAPVRIVAPPQELRVWRFAPTGTPLHRFRAEAPGALPAELAFSLLSGPPWLRVSREGQLTLARPLPAGALPSRLEARVRVLDTVTNLTAEATVRLVVFQLWHRPVIELDIHDCGAASPSLSFADHLLEPGAAVSVLWSSTPDALADGAVSIAAVRRLGSVTALLEAAEVGGAAVERALLRATCKGDAATTDSVATERTSATQPPDCASVAAALITAVAVLAAAVTATSVCAAVAVVFCCRHRRATAVGSSQAPVMAGSNRDANLALLTGACNSDSVSSGSV